VEQADAALLLEQRKAYPSVAPRFGYTRQFQQEAIGYPDVNAWGVGIDMSVPLFDRNQGNIAKARSLKRQAEFNLSAGRVNLAAEVDRAVQSFNAARDILASDDPGQLEAARNVRDKIRAAYSLGGKSLLEVLDAQRAYRETYRLHIAGRSGYWHAVNELNVAIGKQALR
jgi:cobalt-zinc-cadmium efflux system outer membrane protein